MSNNFTNVEKLTTEQLKVYNMLITDASISKIMEVLGKKQKNLRNINTAIYKKFKVKGRHELIAKSRVTTIVAESTAVPTETQIATFVEAKLRRSWPKMLKRAGLPADSVVATELLSILQSEFMQSSAKG